MNKLFVWLFVFLSSFVVNFSVYAQDNVEADWVYTIKPNDTFYSIYRQYLTNQSDVANLSAYNKHKLGDKIFPGHLLHIPVTMLRKTPASVQVLVSSGEVQAQLSAENGVKALKKGDLLTQGDTLVTGKYSVAKLGFADGSVVDVQQNSKITIYSSYQYAGKGTYVIILKLLTGRTEISANPNHVDGNAMQIQTPSAIAAVRGTQFRVAADGDTSIQETLSGHVNFGSAGKSVSVLQGYGSLAEKNKAPLAPIALPISPDISDFSPLFETEHGQVIFELKPQQDVVSWEARLYSDAEFSKIINEKVIKTTQLKFDDLVDGQYFLKLRSQDQHGLSSADALHVFNVKQKVAELVIPNSTLLSPDNGSVIDLAPTEFSWKFKNIPKQYLLQISRDAAFKEIVFERYASSDKTIIQQSFGQGKFYWRIVALYEGKTSELSDSRFFTR